MLSTDFFFSENSKIISRFHNSIFSTLNSMWYNTYTCNFEKFNISENCGVTRTCEFTSTAESHILLYKDNKANYLLHGYLKEYKAVDWQRTNQLDSSVLPPIIRVIKNNLYSFAFCIIYYTCLENCKKVKNNGIIAQICSLHLSLQYDQTEQLLQ